jgi:uncharacterized protein involved in cysteine biosynthesis
MQRPYGGWTFGIFTMLMWFVSAAVPVLTAVPRWIGTLSMLCFLVIHLIWGSAGYYPRGLMR